MWSHENFSETRLNHFLEFFAVETQIPFSTEGSLKQATRMILLPNNRTSEKFSFIHASNKVDSIPTQWLRQQSSTSKASAQTIQSFLLIKFHVFIVNYVSGWEPFSHSDMSEIFRFCFVPSPTSQVVDSAHYICMMTEKQPKELSASLHSC